jgi:hypothetical protein
LGAYQYNQDGKKHRPEKLDKQKDWRNVVKTYLDDPGNEEEKEWSRAIHAKRTKINGKDSLST